MGNCCAIIDESTLGVVESFGKYDRILDPGLHCINCCADRVRYRPSLMLTTFNTTIDTITKDRITIRIKIGIQYKINNDNLSLRSMTSLTSPELNNNSRHSSNGKSKDIDLIDNSKSMIDNTITYNEKIIELSSAENMPAGENSPLLEQRHTNKSMKSHLDLDQQSYQKSHHTPIISVPSPDSILQNPVYNAVYKTKNPTDLMNQIINDYFRGISCNYTMNDLFISNNTFSNELTDILNRSMHSYGYIIIKVLIMDIDPPKEVRDAMNLVSESKSNKAAIITNAEAEKEAKILRAEADSEVRKLEGVGLANQRKALVDGLKESVTGVCGEFSNIDPQLLTSTIIAMQYIDMLDRLGEKGKNTFILSAAPNASKTIEDQVRTAILSADSAKNMSSLPTISTTTTTSNK